MFHQFVSCSCWTIINSGLVRSNKRGVPFEYGSLFLGGTGRFVFFLRMEGGEWGKEGNTLPSQPSHLSHTFDSYLSFHVIKHCKSMIDKCLYCSVSFQLPTLTLVLPFHGSCTLSTPYSLGLLPLPWCSCFLIFFVSNRFYVLQT